MLNKKGNTCKTRVTVQRAERTT